MRIALFCHSLRSDWNHGNAHFLRGVVTELASRGYDVTSYEPVDSWSAVNLRASSGDAALEAFRETYPQLPVRTYSPSAFNMEELLDGVDLAIVHEWNEPEIVAAAGRVRSSNSNLRLLFHDTHHRSVTDPPSMARYDLSHYDGVLAFGESVRQQYLSRGWAHDVWTWHEAADTRVFRPLRGEAAGDLVWIGNWGDDERSSELREFVIEPARSLHLRARAYGVRYPETVVEELERAGIRYMGWAPNFLAPEIFSRHSFTVHVPRRPYARALPGVPTIRVFEALACGIPLISAPWQDSERLFSDESYLNAANGPEMQARMRDLLNDPDLRFTVAERGLSAIKSRHTCRHRVDELLAIYRAIQPAFTEVTVV